MIMAIKSLLSKTITQGTSELQDDLNRLFRSKVNELVSTFNAYEMNSDNKTASFESIELYEATSDPYIVFRDSGSTEFIRLLFDTTASAVKFQRDTNSDFSTAKTWLELDTDDILFANAATLTLSSAYSGNAGFEIGNSSNSGTTAYIDLHYGIGSSQDFNFRVINDADEELAFISPTGLIARFKNNEVNYDLPSIFTFGGATTNNVLFEIGNSSNSGTVVALDFHYGIGSSQDFNYRLINGANEVIWFQNASGDVPLTLTDICQLYEQSTDPATPATSKVGIYPTTTAGKLRLIYDDGSIYEFTGSLVV